MSENIENTPAVDDQARADIEKDIKFLQDSQEERLPEAREVILPVNMKQGDQYVQLGDAIYDAEDQMLVVKFSTPAGRDISNLIGSGVLAGILFGGQISARKLGKNN